MTESLYFEADSHRSLELDTLSAKLGIRVENLLTESLEMLLAAHRQSQSGAEPIGLVADQHGGQGRIRTMIEELTLIRFMTGTVNLMLDEIGFTGDICDSLPPLRADLQPRQTGLERRRDRPGFQANAAGRPPSFQR